jgi:hypothetical protein
MDSRRILQIVPVDGWSAVYEIRPDRNNGDPVWISRLACWALVQQENIGMWSALIRHYRSATNVIIFSAMLPLGRFVRHGKTRRWRS